MSECCMTREEANTQGMKRQAQELIEQAYQRGYKAGYSKAENDYHTKTEDDRQSSYELGMNEAWEAASKVIKMCEYSRKFEIFPECGDGEYPFDKVSASEAIDRIRAYEERKKQEEDSKICVGDEVVNEAGDMAVVIGISNNDISLLIYEWNVSHVTNKSCCKKTGRHFSEIAEVLKKLKEGE